MPLKIKYLEEFVVLANCLNFSQTAQQLYMTQPVLSRHISALEQELGVKLFRRTTQSVALTQAGEVFLEGLEPLLGQYAALCERVRLRDEGYSALLRVGLPYYSTNYYLGHAPVAFMEECPQVKLSYLSDHPDQVIAALARGDVDVLVIAHMPFRHGERFEFQDLFREPLSVLLPQNHPLAGREKVRLKELAGETFLGVESNFFSCTWGLLTHLAGQGGFSLGEPVRLNQMESVLIAVQQGQGILVEGENLHSMPQAGVAVVPLEGEGCFRTVSAVTRRGDQNPALSVFASTLRREHSGQADV